MAGAAEDSSKTLRIALYDNIQPLAWIANDGRPVGVFVEIWKRLGERIGRKIEFIPSNWPDSLDAVRKGNADVHSGLFRTDAREEWLEFSRPIYALKVALYARAPAAPTTTMESLKGKRVGVVRDSIQETFVRENHPEVIPVLFNNSDEVIRATANADVEAFFAAPVRMSLRLADMGLADVLRPTGEALYSGQFHAGVRKGDTELKNLIDEGLSTIAAEELVEIEARWVPDPAYRYFVPAGDPLGLTAVERAWLSEHPKIRVHNETDWPPFNFALRGKPQGFSIDFMNVLARNVGLEVEYVTGPSWSEFLEMMKSGDLDVMLNIVKTPDRQKYLLYTRPYFENPNSIVSRRDTPYDTLEQLFGKTVSVPKGFFYEEILKRDFPRIKLHLVKDQIESMKAVSFGEADAALGELAVFNHLIASHMMTDLVLSGEVKLGDPEYALLNIATRKDLPILASILDKGMQSVSIEDLRTIQRKWLGDLRAPGERPGHVELTEGEKAWLAAHTTIRLGVDPAYPPFEFLAKDGTYSGMAADYVRLISERLGITMKVVPGASWRQVLDGAKARTLDVLPAAASTPERLKYLDFTTSHLDFPIVIVTRDDYPLVVGLGDFTDKSMALSEGYAVTETILREQPGIVPLMVASPLEALKAVGLGKADAAAMNLAVASYMIAKHSLANLKVAAPAEAAIPGMSLAVRSDWPELVGILEKALASISPQEEIAIRTKWIGVRYDPGIDMAEIRGVAIRIGGVAALVLIVILIWNRRLGREVRRRELVLAHMSDGICQLDKDQRFTLFNDRHKQLLNIPDHLIRTGARVEDAVRFLAARGDYGSGDAEELTARRMAVFRKAETTRFDLTTPTATIEFRQAPTGDGGTVVVTTDVTESRRAEEALREAEARFRDFAGAASDWFWEQDEEFRLSYISDRFAKIMGVDARNLLGTTRAEFAGDDQVASDQEKWQRHHEDLLAHRPFRDFSYAVADAKGERTYISLSGIPRYDEEGNFRGYRGTGTDITERERAEAELAEKEAQLRIILDNMPCGIRYVDKDKKYVFFNTLYSQLYDFPEGLLKVGESNRVENLFQAERGDFGEGDPGVLTESWLVALPVDEKPTSWERTTPHGNTLQVNTAPTPSGGVVNIVTDISDRKRNEEALSHARDQAESANRAKSAFLATMSHEIRTPMNAIIGMSHLASRTELTAKQKDYLDKIRSSSDTLLAIINEILDFSKIEADKLQLESTRFRLDGVLDNVSAVIGHRAQEKGLEFLFSVEADTPQALKGDPLRLGQILINLTGNAVKFTEAGEVVIRVGLAKRQAKRVMLRFSVSDTGIGLGGEKADTLFEAFTQADNSTTRKFGGTGLGLSISKHLVEMLGGEIVAENRRDGGSTFSFTAWFGHRPEWEAEEPRTIPDLRSMRVLVVDDNEVSRTVLKEAMEGLSFRVSTVASAEAALEELARADGVDAYRLVLMDWQMPGGIDGIEATGRIKNLDTLVEIPAVLIVTASGREEGRDRAEAAGADAFLLKPVNQSMFLDTLMEVFGRDGDVMPASFLPGPGGTDAVAALRGATVLLVEDNAINQQVACELLEQAGMEVVVSNNGAAALERFSASESGEFDAILMDLQMPEMDGYEATRHIRAGSHAPGIPIVAMTAHASNEERQRCLDAGMNDHLAKPIDPDRLLATLVRWIEPKGGRPASPHPGSAENGDPQLPSIPGIDVLDGLARVRGNRKVYVELLGAFHRGQADTASSISKALDGGDLVAAQQLAHTLKGVSGNLSVKAVYARATELETALRDSPGGDVAAPLAHLAAALDEVMAGLDAVLDTVSDSRGPATPRQNAFPGEIRSRLEKLEALLSASDGEAIDVWEQLRGDLADTMEGSRLSALDKTLRAFDFEKALDTLRAVISAGDE